MSDKLLWLDKHLVLLNYDTVKETAEKEQYKIRPDLEELVNKSETSEKYLKALIEEDKYKDACQYLAYALHRRAAVWWGYNCVMSLHDELEVAPESARDIGDIGKPKPHDIPEWAKEVPEAELFGEDRAKEALAPVFETIEEAKKLIPDEVQKVFDTYMDEVNKQFKEMYGYSPMELLNLAVEKYNQNESLIDEENSPIVIADKELKAQIEKMRQETVDLIKSVLPPTVPEHVKKMRAKAMDAVYSWIAVPNEVNSQKALDVGNECADTPSGLLSLTAFWSFGNLTPTGKQFIPTPAGLAANGLNSVLLNSALHQGGTRKPKERFKHYFELGLKIAYGEDNWEESLEKKDAPHNEPYTNNKKNDNTDNQNKKHFRFRDEPV